MDIQPAVPDIGFVGKIGNGVELLYNHGFTSIVSIIKGVTSLEEALEMGVENLTVAVENVCRVIKIIEISK